jgi:hypothetical protein
MKLPDFTNDPKLTSLRREMGATAPGIFSTTYKPNILTEDELNQLADGGIEVSFNEITELEDGTLGYKDSRVLVYIRDIRTYGGEVQLPRFHVSYCRTLAEMKADHRFERYVVATREDGSFLLNKMNGQKRNTFWERLNVCQNCLNSLSFDEFSYSLHKTKRIKIVDEFTIPRFFEKYPKSLHVRRPQHDYTTAPLNEYTPDFDKISRRVKTERGYKCEECGRAPEARFLHVHHLNGQKNDNNESNLRVLCMGCHAASPRHGHMKGLPGFEEFQRKYNPSG